MGRATKCQLVLLGVIAQCAIAVLALSIAGVVKVYDEGSKPFGTLKLKNHLILKFHSASVLNLSGFLHIRQRAFV